MAQRYTSVMFKVTYVEGQNQWLVDEKQAFADQSEERKEVIQYEISIWSFTCLSLLITIATCFISQ